LVELMIVFCCLCVSMQFRMELPDSWPEELRDVIRVCIKPRESEIRFDMSHVADLLPSS
jgi:hypothetical protein